MGWEYVNGVMRIWNHYVNVSITLEIQFVCYFVKQYQVDWVQTRLVLQSLCKVMSTKR